MQRLTLFVCIAGLALACSKQTDTSATEPPGGSTTPTSEPAATEPGAGKDARTELTEECAGGNASQCTSVALMFQSGEGGEPDAAKARELFEKGCTGGDDRGCSQLAAMLDKGEGGAADAAKARELWIAQCDKGNNGDGQCYGAARSFETANDLAAARKIYGKLCVAGEVTGCVGEARVVMAGNNASDQKHARKVLQDACDAGDGAGCFNLALAMDKGLGGKKDKKAATAMRKKACDAGHKEACGE